MAAIPDDCIPQLHCCAIRVCLLDTDGSPLVGASSMYVTDCLAVATLKPVYQAATEIKEDNACGNTFIDYLGPPTFVRADIDLDFLSPDPYLHAILISQGTLLTVGGGGGVGFQYPPIGPVETNGVSIELFTKRIDDGALSLTHPYAQWALPRVNDLQLGDRAFGGSAQHSLITGQCNENANWLDGPANDFDADTSRVAQWIPADTLPAVACGPAAVLAS